MCVCVCPFHFLEIFLDLAFPELMKAVGVIDLRLLVFTSRGGPHLFYSNRGEVIR